tara:strand:- start:938 stop:2446 length:1509 start_codon:yes stop_codon:yes gene_type:complete
MKKRVVIVGGGINGLTAANYLQKQSFDVKILEKNNNIGGACVKDSVVINKKPVNYPKGATVLGMMQKFIFEETNLSKFIKTYYPKSPKLVYFKNNLEPTRIYQDVNLLKKELQIKWNEKGDIEGFRNDETRVIKYLQNIYKKSTVPDISDAENILGKKITELWIKGSAYDLLNHYFTSEKTKLYMGMTVTESGPASIFQKGTAFTIPLMDSGSIFNGYWGFVKNGIWEISENLGKINESIGVKIDYSVSIKNIDHKSKKIFLDNKEIDYDYLLFATDPITPARLLKDDKIIKTINDKEFIGTSGKITTFFKNPVIWKYPANDDSLDTSFRFIFSNPDLGEFEKSSQIAYKNHKDYEPGYIQIYPEGAAQRKMGNDEGVEKLILFSKNFSFNKKSKDLVDCKQDILNLLSKYIVNFDDLIETKFLTPADLKETFYFPKGNIDHMTLSGNQNFDKRTFSNQPKESFFRYFDYDNIYYCGAGSFPCGSVAGTPGYMCAKHIINFN